MLIAKKTAESEKGWLLTQVSFRRRHVVLAAALIFAQSLIMAFASPAAQAQSSPDNLVEHPPASALAPVVRATTSDATRKMIDEMVIRSLQEQQIPGFALTIVKDDQIVYQRGFGVSDLDTKEPVTEHTIFGLASLTNAFTAFTLLSLVDKNLVQLDAPLSQYVDKVVGRWKPLTIRQLASMTAGISDSKGVNQNVWTEEFQIAQKQNLLPAGGQFLYSNVSYRTLGTLIENVTHENYLDALKKTVFAPLSMNSTGTWVSLGSAGTIASPYDDERGRGPLRKIQYMEPAVNYASGMLFSNSDDLVKYTSALLHHQLLSKQAYNTMFVERPPLANGKPASWAFGWNVSKENYGDRATISMHGGIKGVSSTILLFPDEHVAVIGLCNLWKPAASGIIKNATKLYFGAPDTPNVPEPGVETE